jgi:alpha-N-acetylglucosamine transferase
MSKNNFGYVYAAYGSNYLKRAEYSASSLRRHSQYPITLVTYTNEIVKAGIFDNIIFLDAIKPLYKYYIKLLAMKCSFYDRAIYLDADTLVIENFDELLTVYLDKFDIVAPHSFWRKNPKNRLVSISSSLVGYKKSAEIQKCFEIWEKNYLHAAAKDGSVGDQGFLAESIYESNLRLMITPPEYHCLYDSMNAFHGKVRIISYHENYKNDFNHLNLVDSHRVWSGVDRTLLYTEKTEDNNTWANPIVHKKVLK